MKIACIVPVRKGSQRVPHKNTRRFGDTTLLEHKLKILTDIEGLDVIVNTDCEYATTIAEQFTDVQIHMRDQYYASTECTNAEFFKHIAENVPDEYDTVMYCPVTSPFISKETIENVIGFYMDNDTYDSVITSNTVRQPLWLDGKPINYSLGEAPKSQELPDIQAINFGVAILPRSLQIEYSNVYGRKPYLFNISESESIDIDTLYDFEVAQLIYKQYSLKCK